VYALGPKPDPSCEDVLMLEQFARAPNDQLGGRITDKVKMTIPALLAAYPRGIFPWAVAGGGNARWYNPPERGILDFDRMHISAKDQEYIDRELRRSVYTITFDKAFVQVIAECRAMPRWRYDISGLRVPDGEWITDEFVEKFTELFEAGYAHSVEVWREGVLVAGLYGTFIEGVFAGESMFRKESNVTKLALYALVRRLESRGHNFIDTQVVGGLIEKWGGERMPRAEFLQRLENAKRRHLEF
jgi:leucyl/phenylalanyl-tRNA--protein transferase